MTPDDVGLGRLGATFRTPGDVGGRRCRAKPHSGVWKPRLYFVRRRLGNDMDGAQLTTPSYGSVIHGPCDRGRPELATKGPAIHRGASRGRRPFIHRPGGCGRWN